MHSCIYCFQFVYYWSCLNFVCVSGRHGVRQLQSGWADGPAYITQCPIQTGRSYVYNFTITGQIGTLWYHAHVSWIRATLYGPIIILPKHNESYPFVKPYMEVPIIFGKLLTQSLLLLQYIISIQNYRCFDVVFI